MSRYQVSERHIRTWLVAVLSDTSIQADKPTAAHDADCQSQVLTGTCEGNQSIHYWALDSDGFGPRDKGSLCNSGRASMSAAHEVQGPAS